MVNEITIANDDYLLDRANGIYVARGILTKNERVLRAARKVISSGKYSPDQIQYRFANALQNEEFLRTGEPVDVRSLSGIEALFNELELPENLPRSDIPSRSRLMTPQEYKTFSNWSKEPGNDPILCNSMDSLNSPVLAEIVYDPFKKSYHLADTVGDEEPMFHDVQEAVLNSRSLWGVWYGTREVIGA